MESHKCQCMPKKNQSFNVFCHNDQGILFVVSSNFAPDYWQIAGSSPFSLVPTDRILVGVYLQ